MEPVKIKEILAQSVDGKRFTISIWQHFVEFKDSEFFAIFSSRKEFRTTDGFTVNRIDNKKFFIVGPDIEVSRI